MLFPVEVQPNDVLTYSVHKNGAALSRESQEIIVPGDYGLYAIGTSSSYISCTTASRLAQSMHRRFKTVLLLAASSPIFGYGGCSKANSAALSAKVPHFGVVCALLSNAE